MEFVNVSLPWLPAHYAMIPKIVEKDLRTEQVRFFLIRKFLYYQT